MAKLKRNYITLVKEVKEGEVVQETYMTPVFIPFAVVYEAADHLESLSKGTMTLKEQVDTFSNFIANDIYKKQFTAKEMLDGLHAPDAVEVLQAQIRFVSDGYQSDETKKFLAKKN